MLVPMCSNYTIYLTGELLSDLYQAEASPNLPFITGSIRPTNPAPCVRVREGRRELVGLRWWLVPAKSQGIQSQYPMFNARVETAAEKPSFREPFQRRRCLLLATGWIEGNKSIGKHLMRRTDEKPFALAGLWDRWQRGEQVVESCTMLMTDAAPELAQIHDRMPIILPPSVHDAWLDPELIGPKEAIMSMLQSDLTNLTAKPMK